MNCVCTSDNVLIVEMIGVNLRNLCIRIRLSRLTVVTRRRRNVFSHVT